METDEYPVDRAEIVKGPSSLLYGSDGLGGVVNFRAPEPVAVGQREGSATLNYQTNNRLLGLGLAYGEHRARGFNWQARATGKLAGNYQNRADGPVQNSGYRELNLSGYVGLNKRWGYAHLTFGTFNQQLGIVEGVRDPVTGRFLKRVSGDGPTLVRAPATDADLRGYDNLLAPSQLIEHHRIGLDNSLVLRNGGRLAANVGVQLNQRREFADSLVGKPGEFELSEAALYFLLRTLDYTVRYHLPERYGWNTTVGLNYAGPVVSAGVDAFFNRVDGYIFARRLLDRAGTADSTNAARDRVFKYGQADAVLYGGEARLGVHPLPWLRFENSFATVRAAQRNAPATDQHYLPFTPRINPRRLGLRLLAARRRSRSGWVD